MLWMYLLSTTDYLNSYCLIRSSNNLISPVTPVIIYGMLWNIYFVLYVFGKYVSTNIYIYYMKGNNSAFDIIRIWPIEFSSRCSRIATLISLSLYSFSDSHRRMGTALPFLRRHTRRSASSNIITGSRWWLLIFSTRYST